MKFRKTKNYISSGSVSKHIWIRFRKNKLGLIALSWILFSSIISILGYIITPDSSPFANNQNLELAAQKPGFSVQILMIPSENHLEKTSALNGMLLGFKSRFDEIPIHSFKTENDQLIFEKFTGSKPNDGEIFTLNKSEFSAEPTDNKAYIVNRTYSLGTDKFGRDMLSQIIIGSRVSLSVGFIAVLISLLIGISLGLVSGFYGGKTDQLIMWFINVVWSIPTLLLVIALTMALGRGFWQVFIAVGLTMWVEVARVVRGQVMSIRNKEFVEAGIALGYSKFRILFRHILPNVTSPLIVISAANFASAILVEAGLSFLGIGVQPPIPSWGTMIKEHYGYIILDKAYLALLPGFAIMLMVLAFMLVGNALRDALDVKIVKE
ncbi:MAG: ABC transporter permease [Bacteroidales bacterium]|nr:ABC transporter permease [Bacteroidales bacterium]